LNPLGICLLLPGSEMIAAAGGERRKQPGRRSTVHCTLFALCLSHGRSRAIAGPSKPREPEDLEIVGDHPQHDPAR
jgi:hypothetical protein